MTSKELAKQDLTYIVDSARSAFEKLHGSTILLTGASGFFGTWVLESLVFANQELKLDLKLLLLLRTPAKFPKRNLECVELIEGDVTTFSLTGRKVDHIIHLASPEQSAIALAMKNILELARTQSACSVLFSSSGAVYGTQHSDLLHEEDYPLVLDAERHKAYAEGKRAAEELAIKYFNDFGVETKIARCFCFSGPLLPQDSSYAFGNFIRDGLSKKTICVQGDGSALRSYMDAADLVVWLMQIMVFGKPARPYNVGSEEVISIAELAEKVADACNVKVEIQSPKTGAKPARYVPSTKRAREELGLTNPISLDESIRKTLEWYSHD